jgi:glycosyltransferase involved in cell wall biosynthesis
MRVSTVIAAYNAGRTIGPAIDSALAQDCAHHEVVVVNDGSSDNTSLVLEGYRGRIKVISQENQGAAMARNTGVLHAEGEFIAFLDSDDLWLPGKLERMVGELERNSAASLAFSEYTSFSTAGAEYGTSSLGHSPSMRELMEVSLPPILTSTWVLPKKCFQRAGGFWKAFRGGQGFEDSWLLLILREIGEFIYVPEPFSRYRVDESGENADRYGRGLFTFILLARQRYGQGGKLLVRNAKNLECRFLLTKLAHQMDHGERRAALLTLVRISRLRPAYFLDRQFVERLRLSQNTWRLLQLATGYRR